MRTIDEQNSASSSENRVIGVTVDGSTATVEYVAAEDADIVVALYTDDSEELMSASGTVDVFAMEENTGHSISDFRKAFHSFIVKAFDGCSDLTTVNYAGSPEQWNNIKIANHNDELLNATRHYYSSNPLRENSIFPSTATGNDHSFAASFSDLTPGVSYAVKNGPGTHPGPPLPGLQQGFELRAALSERR